MRTTKELDSISAEVIKLSGGACQMDILAQDEAEATVIRSRLKGKHGAKVIGVRIADGPGDFLPLMEGLANQ
jgi:hypothetical protein